MTPIKKQAQAQLDALYNEVDVLYEEAAGKIVPKYDDPPGEGHRWIANKCKSQSDVEQAFASVKETQMLRYDTVAKIQDQRHKERMARYGFTDDAACCVGLGLCYVVGAGLVSVGEYSPVMWAFAGLALGIWTKSLLDKIKG